MTYNYLTSPYLRVRRADGALAWMAPADLAATGGARPVAFAFGLPVLDIFATELLIGLYQYVVAPASERELLRLLRQPPDAAALREMFASAAVGFDVYGETPAFQDPSVAGEKPSPIGRLLPTAAGEQTRKRNQDILHGEIAAMRPEIAMLALAFIQAHSPAGGRGTRTSLSGGGPLRTWVARDTLYDTVLANLLPRRDFETLGADGGEAADPLPWRRQPKGKRTQDNTPATHIYFACPRRILLAEPEPADPDRACGVSGEAGVPLVTALRQKAEGPDYESTGWRHPLTPYAQRKDKGDIKAFPRLAATLTLGAAWRERWGLFADGGSAGKEGPVAAEVVRRWRDTRARYLERRQVRVRAFGLRCDNAKVESVVDLPFVFRAFPAESTTDIRLFEEHLGDVVRVGGEIAWWLRLCIVEALNGEGAAKEMPRDLERERQIAFWQETEPAFQAYVDDLAEALAGSGDVAAALKSPERQRARLEFQRRLKNTALDLFDAVTEAALTTDAAKDVTVARLKLRRGADKSAHGGIEKHLLEREQA